MDIQTERNRRRSSGFTSKLLPFMAVLAFFMCAFAPAALADTGADAVILNVVTVAYTDASGNNTFYANAAAVVTVTLREAPVTLSGRPTPALPGDTAGQPAAQTSVTSGTTVNYLYALTTNANGDDTYDLTIGIDVTGTSNVANQTITTALMEPDGTTVLSGSPADATLGASAVVGIVDGDSLLFPGGTLGNIEVDDIVVIEGVDYRVAGVVPGSGASHDHSTGTPQSDLGALTAEVPGQLDLAINNNGSQRDPDFIATPPSIGALVREQVLLQVQIYAEASLPGTDGIVDISLVVEPDGTPNSNTAEVQDFFTTFSAVDLTILKEVRNFTDTPTGPYASSVFGDSGDVLEYRVTITNNGGIAANVVVTDEVPDYTTLVLAGGDFASYTSPSGSGTVSSAVDDENADDVSGDNTGIAAGEDLRFFVGQGQIGSTTTGGVIQNGETFIITYQVRIN